MKTRVVNITKISQDMRFDGSFHNAEINIYNDVIDSHSSHNLDYYCENIFTSGRNKRVYTTKKFGYPFLSNSDVTNSYPFSSCNYSSKKYGYDEDALLKGGMILTGRVGAIGQTAFVPYFWERYNAMGSDNIIRIKVKPEYKNGFIYAYLASKVGNLSFWKHSTGGVQPFITDKMVSALPIPDFPESFQKEVDDLIQESARLREEATDALDDAHRLFMKSISIDKSEKRTNRVSIQTILHSHNCRFEGSYFTSRNRDIYNAIIGGMNYRLLGEMTDRIFRPGIFKRDYVKNGVKFLGGADILMAIPDSYKQLSFKQVQRMPELKVKRGWILATCGGTIGNTVFIDSQLEKCVISQHVMRIVPKADVLNGYLYAVLSSDYGHQLFNLYSSGSVIPQIEAHHIERIPIPMIEKSKMELIESLICQYVSKIEKSKEKEISAISMVESEIEKWNKN